MDSSPPASAGDLLHSAPAFGFQIKVFFLLCVIVAGVYGAASVSRRILYVQAAPAAPALILLWLAKFLRLAGRHRLAMLDIRSSTYSCQRLGVRGLYQMPRT